MVATRVGFHFWLPSWRYSCLLIKCDEFNKFLLSRICQNILNLIIVYESLFMICYPSSRLCRIFKASYPTPFLILFDRDSRSRKILSLFTRVLGYKTEHQSWAFDWLLLSLVSRVTNDKASFWDWPSNLVLKSKTWYNLWNILAFTP